MRCQGGGTIKFRLHCIRRERASGTVRFSQAFSLDKSQCELDFVDVFVDDDLLVFVDPFALSRRRDDWSRTAHETVVAFFQRIVDKIREGNEQEARDLLSFLREPSETHL